jgi:hypothetical protein
MHSWLHTRGATLIVFLFLSISDEMPHAGDALSYHVVAKVERPLFLVILLHGNRPPVPTCLALFRTYVQCPERRLSSVSRSRMRSETRIHSELPLCFGSLLAANLILCSINAGQSVYLGTDRCAQCFLIIKNSSRFVKCQSSVCQIPASNT